MRDGPASGQTKPAASGRRSLPASLLPARKAPATMSGPAAASRKKDALDYSRFDAIVVSDDEDAPPATGDDEEEFEEVSASEDGSQGEGSQPESDADESPEELDDLVCVAHCTDAGSGTAGTAVPQAPPVYCTCGRCGAAVSGLGALCSGKGAGGVADGAGPGPGTEDGGGHDGEVDGSAEGTKPGAAGQPGGPPHCALHAGAPLPALPPVGEERYDGELDGTGQRHGYGRYVWRNGAVYEGTVRWWEGETSAAVGGPLGSVLCHFWGCVTGGGHAPCRGLSAAATGRTVS